MKKRNEKGFLLAESIIVGVFVLSLFTFLFVNIIPLVGEYENEEKYDTISSVYNTNLIRSMIMGDANVNDILKLTQASGTVNTYNVFTGDSICNRLDKKNFCKKLLNSTYLDVHSIYITWYRTNKIKDDVKNHPHNFPRAVRDYVGSMDKYTQPAGDTYDKYKRVIVYYNDGTFANLEIKVKE